MDCKVKLWLLMRIGRPRRSLMPVPLGLHQILEQSGNRMAANQRNSLLVDIQMSGHQNLVAQWFVGFSLASHFYLVRVEVLSRTRAFMILPARNFTIARGGI